MARTTTKVEEKEVISGVQRNQVAKLLDQFTPKHQPSVVPPGDFSVTFNVEGDNVSYNLKVKRAEQQAQG